MSSDQSDQTNQPESGPDARGLKTGRAAISERATIIVIGDTESAEFRRLIEGVSARRDCVIVAEFPTIATALKAGAGTELKSDLVLVLQSWSDQYPRTEIDGLIGRMLFSRILCCYGAWCASDGRNRDYWPVALRVAAGLAESVLNQELQRWRQGQLPLFPTAAAEELFPLRCGISDDQKFNADSLSLFSGRGPIELRNAPVLLVSCDFFLRRVWSAACRSMGMVPTDCGLLRVQQSSDMTRSAPAVVIHDLDPGIVFVRDSVQQIRLLYPRTLILGAAAVPETLTSQQTADLSIHAVFPKLDILHGLCYQLSRCADMALIGAA